MSASDMLSELNLTFSEFLRPHLAVTAGIERLVLYRARFGRQPQFRSSRDAQAFDAGWLAWPDPKGAGVIGTPHAAGWDAHDLKRECDLSRDQLNREDDDRDAYDELMERES